MGGTSNSTQSTNQSSTTAPWTAAQPTLQGILGQLNTGLSSSAGITGTENDALSRLTANSANAMQYAPQISNLVGNLFNGGGADAQSGNISQALQDYQRRLNPIADGANIGPGGNPALQGYLSTIGNDVQSRVNGMFAGAGRDMSGMNQQTLARGITEGQAPILAQQYNTDVGNMRSAADSLYGASNNTAGLLTGLNQQGLANQQAGAGMAQTNYNNFNDSQNAVLQAEAARRGIPVQALGLLANIGIPIAGLGSQSTGQSTTQGRNQMSGAQQFATIGQGVNSFLSPFSGGGNGGGTNAARFLFG